MYQAMQLEMVHWIAGAITLALATVTCHLLDCLAHRMRGTKRRF